MTATLGRPEIDRFRTLVAKHLGLGFEDGKLDYLADVLRGRLQDTSSAHAGAYLGRLEAPGGWRDEWRALAERLTVAETYFFRYGDHFRAFTDVVLPDRAGRGEIRILSAGCASGEEPYTLAILVRERLGDAAGGVRILGIDVNPAMIQKARRGRYSAWSLRETPPEVRDRTFGVEGREFVLDEAIRSMVTFEERNLVDPDPLFWPSDAFDIVFCRNVTMYFPPDVSRAVIARLAGSLRSGGYLFLGHAETLRGISDGFHLRHTHGTFYYQRRKESAIRVPADPVPIPALARGLPSVELLDSSGSWMEVIQRASERIAALADATPAAPGPEAVAAPAPRPAWDLGIIVELLRRERFDDAMKLLKALPAESARDPDTQLLRAVILTNGGDLKGARETCRQILESDELNAGAHYLMALCLEHEGDPRSAAEHDQTSAYLDPSFAMPRFHLGLLAKRRGDLAGARGELTQALALLAREDSSRILLFGGGFSRDALVELCRNELRACGGAA
jgi:chemotaxis protein methyltransferase CheR